GNCDLKGTTPDVVIIVVDTTKLDPGSYTATLVISAPGTPDVRVPVDLTVDPPNVATAVSLSPELMRFTVPAGATDTQQLIVASPGQNTLNWTILPLADTPWLTFGVLSGTTRSAVNVGVDASSLAPGT